ncbi:hypothetical protein EYF80_060739 [Liparis tanakae]|uniref:Uncharacterized protein n=1 Tax=Liparis tanakae TaxID=230148 RepID=A0A4Z2EL72_9TELE|nr:hypothetical protein EYF80_060739 [Liparis tanakae]
MVVLIPLEFTSCRTRLVQHSSSRIGQESTLLKTGWFGSTRLPSVLTCLCPGCGAATSEQSRSTDGGPNSLTLTALISMLPDMSARNDGRN